MILCTKNPSAQDVKMASQSEKKPSSNAQKRACIQWKTIYYDDEAVLLHIRSMYPDATWSSIASIFNRTVPPERMRSDDSISSKGRSLLKIHPVAGTLAAPLDSATASGTQFEQASHLRSKVSRRASLTCTSICSRLQRRGMTERLVWKIFTATGMALAIAKAIQLCWRTT